MRINRNIRAEETRNGFLKGGSSIGKSIERFSGGGVDSLLWRLREIAARPDGGGSDPAAGNSAIGPFVNRLRHAMGGLTLSCSNRRAACSIDHDFSHTGDTGVTGVSLHST